LAQPIDPIHQFRLHDLAGPWNIAGYEISFTNSSLFMAIIVAVVNFIVDVIAALVDPRVRY